MHLSLGRNDSIRMMRQSVPFELVPLEVRKMMGRDLGKDRDKGGALQLTRARNLLKKLIQFLKVLML